MFASKTHDQAEALRSWHGRSTSPFGLGLAAILPFGWAFAVARLDHAAPIPNTLSSRNWWVYSLLVIDIPATVLLGAVAAIHLSDLATGFLGGSNPDPGSAADPAFRELLLAGALGTWVLSRLVAMVTTVRAAEAHNAGLQFELGLRPMPKEFQGAMIWGGIRF